MTSIIELMNLKMNNEIEIENELELEALIKKICSEDNDFVTSRR